MIKKENIPKKRCCLLVQYCNVNSIETLTKLTRRDGYVDRVSCTPDPVRRLGVLGLGRGGK